MDGKGTRLVLSREKRKPSGPRLVFSIGFGWVIDFINQRRDDECEVSAYLLIKPHDHHGYRSKCLLTDIPLLAKWLFHIVVGLKVSIYLLILTFRIIPLLQLWLLTLIHR